MWDQLKGDSDRRAILDREDVIERQRGYNKAGDRITAFTRPTVTGHELIDPDESDGLLCMRAAKGDVMVFERLYEDTPLGEVLYMYALQIAAEYHQQLTERDTPKGLLADSEDEDIDGLPDFA